MLLSYAEPHALIGFRQWRNQSWDLPRIIVPKLGTSFDRLGEAYDFNNLYSWEKGFGIIYGKSRLNVNQTKRMQEIVCGCALWQFVSIFLEFASDSVNFAHTIL